MTVWENLSSAVGTASSYAMAPVYLAGRATKNVLYDAPTTLIGGTARTGYNLASNIGSTVYDTASCFNPWGRTKESTPVADGPVITDKNTKTSVSVPGPLQTSTTVSRAPNEKTALLADTTETDVVNKTYISLETVQSLLSRVLGYAKLRRSEDDTLTTVGRDPGAANGRSFDGIIDIGEGQETKKRASPTAIGASKADTAAAADSVSLSPDRLVLKLTLVTDHSHEYDPKQRKIPLESLP